MLVVIGIIVALAAVIVPLVIQFSGEGADASADAEWDAVQTTIDTMMADNEIDVGTLAPGGGAAGAQIADTLDFDPGAGIQTIAAYTRDPITNYCYTWDNTGRLLFQYEFDTTLAIPACAGPAINP